MTDRLDLGPSDAESRWIGIRRHQALLVLVGTTLAGDWLTRTRAHPLELVLAFAAFVLVVPARDGATVFESASAALGFLSRRRWTRVAVREEPDGVRVLARGEAVVEGHQLVHRGRLDLSGADLVGADALAALADGLATTAGLHHLSVHVRVGPEQTSTVLALPPHIEAPDGWRRRDAAVEELVGDAHAGSTWRLERWRHLRDQRGVLRVLRVEDFAGALGARGQLELLQRAATWSELALHVEVLGGPRAHRVAARAVHGTRSDAAVSSAAGFRRSARSARSLDRFAQREALVASGRALIRIGLYVVVRAPTLEQLHDSVTALEASARAAGLRCRRGAGHQALWYCQQLPGGPGW